MPDFTTQFISATLLESKPLKGLRVGIIRETLDNGVDTGVKSVVLGAVSHLEELGCTLSEVPLTFSHSCYIEVYANYFRIFYFD